MPLLITGIPLSSFGASKMPGVPLNKSTSRYTVALFVPVRSECPLFRAAALPETARETIVPLHIAT